MSPVKPLTIDIVSDVVCPWCYIGKHRIEEALKLVPDVPVQVNWRPFFLNPWVPREGISREQYLTTKFGSVDAYKGIAGRVVEAASQEGLVYRPELVQRQPNNHRLSPPDPLGRGDRQGRRHEAAADGIVFPRRRRSHRHQRTRPGRGRLRPRRGGCSAAPSDRRGCRAGLGECGGRRPRKAFPAYRPMCSRRSTRCRARKTRN